MSEPQYCIRCDDHHNGDCDSGWISRTAALQARVRELEAENAKLVRMHENDCHFAVKVEEANARLRKLVDMNQRVVDAVRTHCAGFPPDEVPENLMNAIREYDGE